MIRASPLKSSGLSSSSSITSKTLPLPCRCTTLPVVPLDKVKYFGPATLYTIVQIKKTKKLADPVTLNLWGSECVSLCLPDEFARAVYVATGLKLTRHLVNTIFKIFDVDHDDQLSYKEFVGIMKDRLHRGGRVREGCRGKSGASSLTSLSFKHSNVIVRGKDSITATIAPPSVKWLYLYNETSWFLSLLLGLLLIATFPSDNVLSEQICFCSITLVCSFCRGIFSM